MAAESWVRAADVDREETVEILRHAHAEGQLDPVELAARTDTAYLAQTIGELRELIADVPPRGSAASYPPDRPWPAAVPDPHLGPARRRRVSLVLLVAMVACVVIGAATRDTAVIALGLAAGVAAAVLRRWSWRR